MVEYEDVVKQGPMVQCPVCKTEMDGWSPSRMTVAVPYTSCATAHPC